MRVVEYRKTSRKRLTGKKSDVMAYARITVGNIFDSERGLRKYDVARYRDRTYRCTCLSALYRRRDRCKHVKTFIAFERSAANNRLRHFVTEIIK